MSFSSWPHVIRVKKPEKVSGRTKFNIYVYIYIHIHITKGDAVPCSLMLRMSILHGRTTKEKVLVTIRILLSHAFPRSPALKYPQLIVAFQNSTLALTKWSQISTCRPMWATQREKMGGSTGSFGDSNSLCFSRVAGKALVVKGKKHPRLLIHFVHGGPRQQG